MAMSEEKQLQYYAKIMTALGNIFNEESECYIDVYDENFSANDFIHVVATRVPHLVFVKLTSNEVDPLEFNHICNKLIMQDREDNGRKTVKRKK